MVETEYRDESSPWEAYIFDLDGVVTDTARVHARAWKAMFDGFLEKRCEQEGCPLELFDPEADYRRHVDGKPRYEGVADFLASRDISLPHGTPDDAPALETVCGLGNRKNAFFQDMLGREGATVYQATVRLIRRLKAAGRVISIVSSSKNCAAVLHATNLTDLFDVRVDGVVSEELGLSGKPRPDIFLKAAEMLGVAPDRAVVVEDSLAGIEAGQAGGFGEVVGLSHNGQIHAMLDRGADRVVLNAEELEALLDPEGVMTDRLPSARDHEEALVRALRQATPVFFLDYDGTLTPIVERPEDAWLSREMADAISALAAKAKVAVISGRDLNDVKQRVDIEGLYYAGSHGYDVEDSEGESIENSKGREALPALNAAEKRLHALLDDLEGAMIERKKFSIAVHYRRVDANRAAEVKVAVDTALREQKGLRKGEGKKVLELQPDVDWNKGKAAQMILEALSRDDQPKTLPVYLGDDVTDEDAFEALAAIGIGIVVHTGDPKPTGARYRLDDPGQVHRFLDFMAGRLDRETGQ